MADLHVEHLVRRCLDPGGPAVTEAAGLTAADASRAAAALETRLIVARTIDAAAIHGKEELLDQVARAFAFPDHFGRNWDALLDCLSDFSWLPAQGWVCFLLHADHLKKLDAPVFDTFQQVCAEASERWRSRPAGYFKLVLGQP